MLTIALPKGRLQKKVLERFAFAGVVPEEEPGSSRRLIVPALANPALPSGARFVLLKDGDVPLYVERGTADLGICGLDQLLESGADLLSPVDLGFGKCRLSLAGPKLGVAAMADPFAALADTAAPGRSLRIATKYPRLAARAFARRGVPVDLVRLSGSVELAAVAGLADAIVDLEKELAGASARHYVSSLRESAAMPAFVADATARIIADVRARGDVAVRELTHQFDGPDLESPFLPEAEWDRLAALCPAPVRAALELAAERVRAFHRPQIPQSYEQRLPDGARLRNLTIPLERAACYVPGGRAAYPLTGS